SWDRVAGWYDGWVGERGSTYHQAVAIPAALELLDPQLAEEILDLGAGQGVLAPYIVERGARYTGLDASPRLIAAAKRRHGSRGRFLLGDARDLRKVDGIRPASYDAAVFLLSIQDIDPIEPVLDSVTWALRPTGRVVIVMTHPAFRQPRHSGWGFDESRKLQFRRVDSYLTPMAVSMKSIGGEPPTRSFHRPLSSYVDALANAGFVVDAMREIADLPPDRRPGKQSRAASRADAEIPMFLALRALRR
ncbi:MAG: class I SAM-dependent methyltransferase, partial [Candidatus Limnocylindrales bacterium]